MDTGVNIFTAENYASQSLVKREVAYSIPVSEISAVFYLLCS